MSSNISFWGFGEAGPGPGAIFLSMASSGLVFTIVGLLFGHFAHLSLPVSIGLIVALALGFSFLSHKPTSWAVTKFDLITWVFVAIPVLVGFAIGRYAW